MLGNRAYLVLALALLLIAGCRTVAIPEPYVISLPEKMTAQQAEVAAIAGILNSPPPKEFDPTKTLSDEEFESLIWRDFVSVANGRSWFLESRQGNRLHAAVDTRGLYLRALVEIHPESIRISIVESRNLSQSESRIHKRAIKWLQNLEAHIRREVGRMALFAGRTAWDAELIE